MHLYVVCRDMYAPPMDRVKRKKLRPENWSDLPLTQRVKKQECFGQQMEETGCACGTNQTFFPHGQRSRLRSNSLPGVKDTTMSAGA